VVLAAALSTTGSGWASTDLSAGQGPAVNAQVPVIRPMNDAEQQSIGCIASAAATMVATYAVGPSEIIMLVVGGVIVPSSSSVLAASLMATMASLGCVGGATITPLVTRAWKELNEEQPASVPVTEEVATLPSEMQALANAQQDQGERDYTYAQGMGCIVAGGGSALAGAAIGASETLMITAGGLLVPSASPTLWLGIISTLVAGTCSLGAVATPGLLWAYEQKENIGDSLSQVAGFSGDNMAAVQPIGATFTPVDRGTLVPMPSAVSLVTGVR